MGSGQIDRRETERIRCAESRFLYTGIGPFPAEAAVFWPLYNEMQKKNREIEADMRKSFHEVRNAKGLKETDYKEAIGKMLGYEARLHEVKKEYYQKMIQVVPASKIWKLSDAGAKISSTVVR